MGKEVKIGLAVGSCFILLVGIWFFGFYNSKPSDDGIDPKEELKPAATTGGNRSASTENRTASADPLRRNAGAGALTRDPADATPATRPDPAGLVGRDDPLRNRTAIPPAGVRPAPAGVGPAVGVTPGPAAGSNPVPGTGATPPAAPGTGKAQTYTVKSGDSLWALATHYYGDHNKMNLILAANPALKPGAPLRVGMTLTIPEAPAKAATPGAVAGNVPTAAGPDAYVVKAGDAFDRILATKYGSVGAFREEIAALNKDVLTNGYVIRPGMVLKLPTADKLKAGAKPADPLKSLDLAKGGPKADPLRTGKPGEVVAAPVAQPGNNRFLGID